MSLLVDIEKQLGSFPLRVRFETGTERLALLGASGSGKSMTLKCIAGIERPDRGRIVLDGQVLFDSEQHIDLPPQKRRVGYLFQQYALFPNMTAAQNILCGIREGTRAQKQALLAQTLRRFHLEGLERKLPAHLSGGEQQRVALARILCSRPKAILLDEPFSALDSFLKWELEQALRDMLADFGGPIVWVSHDLAECRRSCGTICVMEHGAGSEAMSFDAFLRRPGSVAAARLIGCRNFLRAQVCDSGLCLPEWNLTLPLPAPEGVSVLVVPSEAVDLTGSALRFRVRRIIPELHGVTALLLPENAPETAPPLRVLLPPAAVPEVGAALTLSLRPEALWFF